MTCASVMGLQKVFREFRVACVHLRKERDALDSLEETGASLHGGFPKTGVILGVPMIGVYIGVTLFSEITTYPVMDIRANFIRELSGRSFDWGVLGVTLAVLRTQPTSGVLGSECFDLFSRHLWIFHDTARPLTGLA